ncbi:diaminobutyrate acetyltransferase [Plastorhodobacter daqingensis]|uniref:L-2,4-diaminobutyric acid acetyltransferase n=1 Tax=Plastorhodobacter daqingensis TaxID=1387281 RepID=A0ABW2UHS4_9RHOB
MPDLTRTAFRKPISLRRPQPEDGAAVWSLVRECAPLDENSMYCNLIQCDHFRDTCVLAEREEAVVGWISGHLMPADPRTLFVWQVAVAGAARGEGLARRMLEELLARPDCAGVRQIKTTITADNRASWALFEGFAARTGAVLTHDPHYTRDRHFAGAHATEHMATITLAEAARRAA